ncbi:NAD(P)/FAD-dependent oxidoreductase [Streptomyces sp. SP17BM10]|uniref:FAD-dependent oxidoreductase n=1 Tax=Streptomyces sp. SP17BM10 TaxID=3002530 RepID=UPI002E798B0D|nr:NAD(P)/FAD-dependent oxidoreductase [Streptomyces sp. SP17BM10]MEE1783182.1 NAD(P)/FAD-dependent oxidoreductase [Streptomyces sp. SP17BM10]
MTEREERGMKVIVAGAGIGGLCLAQGLVRAGIDVRVYEREPAADSRYQGFRIALNEHGLGALRDCLPPRLYRLLEAVTGPLVGQPRVVDRHLTELRRLDPTDGGAAADRRILREILLAGLGDRVEFGRAVTGYAELPDGRVEVRLSDGGSTAGDLLVGADGVGSSVRRQLLPDARLVDIPGNSLLGRTPLTGRFAALVPGFGTLVQGPGLTMLLGRMEFRRPPRLAAAELAPEVELPDTDSYLRWVVTLPEQLTGDDWATVRDLLLPLLDGWHPDLVELVRASDVVNSSPLTLRYTEPVPHWGTGPVTLLGDAIHTMPPSAGKGANTALRDAALLCRMLTDAHRDGTGLHEAVESYEHEMLAYGFAAVTESLERLPNFTPKR